MVPRETGSKTSESVTSNAPAYPDSIQFFGGEMSPPSASPKQEPAPEMLLDGLAKKPTAEWVNRYAQTKYKKEFVESRTGQLPSRTAQHAQQTAVRKPGIGQWITLMHRNAVLRFRDKGQLMFTALQSILFPLLMAILYHDLPTRFQGESFAKNAMACHFLLVVAAVWFGVNNAARDIVGEWAIFVREDRKSTRLNSSHQIISYAVFCLKKKKT